MKLRINYGRYLSNTKKLRTGASVADPDPSDPYLMCLVGLLDLNSPDGFGSGFIEYESELLLTFQAVIRICNCLSWTQTDPDLE